MGKSKKLDRWSNITGEAYIFAKVFGTGKKAHTAYSVSVSRKEDNDEYSQLFLPVRFVKDAAKDILDYEADKPIHVDIKDGFLSFDQYTKKDGTECKQITLVVMDFDAIED